MPQPGSPDNPKAPPSVQVTEAGGVHVVSFLAGDRGSPSHEAIRTYFAGCFLEHTRGWSRLVLDLAGVPALDSAALGPLVQKLRETQEARGRLVLTGVDAPALREIFALTRFDRVFTIVADRAAAVAAAQA